jgi:hypothetical protein
LPLDTSTVASRHDELLRQVVRGSLARLLPQLAAVRTILLDSFREQGADASGTRLLFSANVLFTLTCALISSAAVTISVEREADLFVIGFFPGACRCLVRR